MSQVTYCVWNSSCVVPDVSEKKIDNNQKIMLGGGRNKKQSRNFYFLRMTLRKYKHLLSQGMTGQQLGSDMREVP